MLRQLIKRIKRALGSMEDATKLRRKFYEWKTWLEQSDDINSLNNQIFGMLWDKTVSLSYEELKPKSAPMSTPLINNWALRNYLKAQAVQIRKLCEANPQIDRGRENHDVYSLRRLLDEFRANRKLLTFKNLCTVYGVPDDPGEISRHEQEMLQRLGTGTTSYTTSTAFARKVHKALGQVCGSSGERLIKKSLLTKLQRRLDHADSSCRRVVNKVIVHNSSKESREDTVPRDLELSIGSTDKAIEDLIVVYAFFSFFITQGFMMTFLLNNWESHAQGLSRSQLEAINQQWQQLDTKIDRLKDEGYRLAGSK